MLIKTSKTRTLRFGRTRSEQCENLRKVYGGSGGMSDENLDKCKFVEKKLDIRQGFLSQSGVSQVK
jgi:hypothetical protein